MPEGRLPTAALIVPALDEEEAIGDMLKKIPPSLFCTVIVADNGSRDRTAEIARQSGAVVVEEPRKGYGAACLRALAAVPGGTTAVVFMQADCSEEPREAERLLAPIAEGRADLVLGSRFLVRGSYRMGALRSLGRRLFQALGRLAGLEVSDPTSGFQALNRRVLEVYARDFFPTDYPDVDVLLAARRNRLRVGERPVQMRAGTRASTLHGGLRSVYYVYKMLLSTWTAARRRWEAPAPEARRP